MTKQKNTNTENKILEAAERIFQKKGMDGARMQEIADEAGINKAMLHYYYRSKQQLFEEVFKKAFSMLALQLNRILNDDSSVKEKIRSFSYNYITFISKNPYLPNFIIQELNKNPDFILSLKNKKEFPNLEKFKNQIAKEVKKGILKPIKAEQLFINIISLNAFPFIGESLIKGIANIDDVSYNMLIEERKTQVSDFIIDAIKTK